MAGYVAAIVGDSKRELDRCLCARKIDLIRIERGSSRRHTQALSPVKLVPSLDKIKARLAIYR